MEVYFSLIDWMEAQSRLTNGTFASDVFEADDDEAWIQETDFTDVLQVVFSIGATLDSVLPHCSQSVGDAVERSIGRFLTEEPKQCNDLPAKLDPETFWLVLSPSTVSEISSVGEGIDFEELRAQFQIHCPQDVREELAYSADDFVEHLQSWCSLFQQAANNSRGLLATVG